MCFMWPSMDFFQHSMMYFFHHYELPAVLHRTTMLQNQHRRFQINQLLEGNRVNMDGGESTAQTSGGGDNPSSHELSRNTNIQVNRQLTAVNNSSYNSSSGAQLPDNINDPTSLEYIEHLLEELIPARNGIVSNSHAQHQGQTPQQQTVALAGTQGSATYSGVNRNGSSLSNSSSSPNRSWETISGEEQNHESVSVADTGGDRNNVDLTNRNEGRLLTPVGPNVALYPFQHLIVSLLIRLLNFIQSGSHTINHHRSPSPSAADNEGSSNFSIDQTYPDASRSSLDGINSTDLTSNSPAQSSLHVKNDNDTMGRRMTNMNPRMLSQNQSSDNNGGVFCLSGTRAPQHRRTQSANNIPRYHAEETEHQFGGNG